MLLVFVWILVIIGVLVIAGVMDRGRERDKYEDRKRLWHDRWQNVLGWSIIFGVVSCVIFGGIWGSSYNSYVDTRVFYDATREQYAEAVTVYKDHAVIDMGKATFTDFKYQGYQDNVAELVIHLRNEIVNYNKTITEKRVMARNPLFSWFIIEPDDDMKIIKMKAPTAGMPE